jgi:DNA helicase-2/ATP-dependent DNA helicase PcrA
MKINLSSCQREIVNFDNGAILVKAGPGSGKTRVLIERIKRIICANERTKVLALTFSNMAAEEMKTRIEDDQNIGDLVDNVTVGTIHSFCLDIVQTRGYLIGLPNNLVLFENLEDRKNILADSIQDDADLRTIFLKQPDKDHNLANCLSFIAGYKRKFILPEDTNIPETNAAIYSAYNQQLLAQGAIDFDDILLYAYRIFTEHESVANLFTTKYRYICVDEAQDLNFAQYAVIKALCRDKFKNIMFVGDENQSVYGFNGSDSSLMCNEFVKDFEPRIFLLNENFRCAKTIVDYANTLEISDDYANCYYNGELQLLKFNNENEEAEYVISKIEYLMKNGHADIETPLNYKDIAIIARNKYVFPSVENLLKCHDIPFFHKKPITGIESESAFFQAFDLELRLLANGKDIVHSKELANLYETKFLSTGSNFINQIVSKIDPETFDLRSALNKMKEQIVELEISDDDKYMALNDYELWKQHWSRYIAQVPSEQRTLMSFRNYIALGKTQIVESNDGVSLLTAHMSKGLQFEVVFIIGMTEGTFPDYRATGEKALNQEKNNLYVAVTRAKRLCYLSYPCEKMMPWGDSKRQQPSRFLKPLMSNFD